MVVALGALHADAEEQLGGRLSQVLRIAGDAVIVGRWVGKRAALGREQVADDPVERRVLLKLLAQPVLVNVDAFFLNGLAAAAQHVRPLQRPEVGILGPVEQPVDEPGPFVLVLALQECFGFVARRRDAAEIEIDAADEFLIGAQVRWLDAEQLELGGWAQAAILHP